MHMRFNARFCVILVLVVFSGCGSKKPVVVAPPVEPPQELPQQVAPQVVVAAPRVEPELKIVAPTREPDSIAPAAPLAPIKIPLPPAVASLRNGFEKRGAELRAGALLVTESTHIERWTFDDNGIWLHCRANAGDAKTFVDDCEKSAQLFVSARDQEALGSAIGAAFNKRNERVSMEELPWVDGENFRFRAQKAGETLVIMNAQCLQTGLKQSLLTEFAAERNANAKYRDGSSESYYVGRHGAYSTSRMRE